MTNRRDEIAEAATTLITEANGEFPTVRQIATRSFLSPAAIYVHFDNVDAILSEVLMRSIAEVMAELEARNCTTFDEAVAVIAQWIHGHTALVSGLCGNHIEHIADPVVQLLNSSPASSALTSNLATSTISAETINAFRGLISPIPMLVDRLSFTVDDVSEYLTALGAPLGVIADKAV